MYVPNGVSAEYTKDSFFFFFSFALEQEPKNSHLSESLNLRLKQFLLMSFFLFSSLFLSPFSTFPRSLCVSRRMQLPGRNGVAAVLPFQGSWRGGNKSA